LTNWSVAKAAGLAIQRLGLLDGTDRLQLARDMALPRRPTPTIQGQSRQSPEE